jgi:hypothetical protein
VNQESISKSIETRGNQIDVSEVRLDIDKPQENEEELDFDK